MSTLVIRHAHIFVVSCKQKYAMEALLQTFATVGQLLCIHFQINTSKKSVTALLHYGIGSKEFLDFSGASVTSRLCTGY